VLLADIGSAMLTFPTLFGSTNTIARKAISVGLSRGQSNGLISCGVAFLT
jgi:hypothetical protein